MPPLSARRLADSGTGWALRSEHRAARIHGSLRRGKRPPGGEPPDAESGGEPPQSKDMAKFYRVWGLVIVIIPGDFIILETLNGLDPGGGAGFFKQPGRAPFVIRRRTHQPMMNGVVVGVVQAGEVTPLKRQMRLAVILPALTPRCSIPPRADRAVLIPELFQQESAPPAASRPKPKAVASHAQSKVQGCRRFRPAEV